MRKKTATTRDNPHQQTDERSRGFGDVQLLPDHLSRAERRALEGWWVTPAPGELLWYMLIEMCFRVWLVGFLWRRAKTD